MTKQANIHIRDAHLWSCCQSTHVRGEAFDGSSLLDSSQLASLFAAAEGDDAFISLLERLNGFFAVVQLTETVCRIAVDQIRSIPVFYGICDGLSYVSDDCHWVQQRVRNDPTNEVARAEYLHLGFVTGSDTLCPDVKQCLAGEATFIKESDRKPDWRHHRYYLYRHEPPKRRSTHEYISDHQRVLEGVFRRLIAKADNRTIVLPLSGGYDSRLVALMLRMLKYTNVVAFSYGRPGNVEAHYSEQVAADLGMEWKFVPYSNGMWAEWYHSRERVRYQQYNGSLSSIMHVQDCPAIWQLLRDGDIPPDSLVVPGHTGDFVAGGRSSYAPDLYNSDKLDRDRIIDASINYHYSLWPDRFIDDPMRRSMTERLRQQVQEIISASAETNGSVFETWNWENRQAKFIVNSIRVYDFHKLAWWLPLWDKEYLDFWARAPQELRMRKLWYNSFVRMLYQQVSGKQGLWQTVPVTRRIKKRITQQLRRFAILRAIRKVTRRPPQPMAVYNSDPLSWYGFIPEAQFGSLYTGSETINSFLAADALGTIMIADPRSQEADSVPSK